MLQYVHAFGLKLETSMSLPKQFYDSIFIYILYKIYV